MKSKLLALLATVALAGVSNAFIVTIESGFDKAVTTSNDLPVASGSGFVATGFFTSLSDAQLATSTSATLQGAFQLFGTSGTFGFGGFGGVYEVESAGGRIGAASAFANQSIYTILGNGTTIGNSTEFVIYKHAGTFQIDDADANDKTFNATLGGAGGAYLMGSVTGGTVEIAGQPFPQVEMAVAVPEPSAALLGLLGAVGLIRRRR